MIRTGTALALFCALCVSASAGADEAAARRELDVVLARYDALFAAKFRVNATCPEANAILKGQIAGLTQRMFGFALQIDVDHFVFLYNRGRSQVRVALANLPAQQKKQMEEEANKLLRDSPFGNFVRALCYDALRQGVAYLREHKEQCTVKQETDRVIDFLVDAGRQEVIKGLTLRSAWFRIDRVAKVISGIQFTFDNGKTMLIKMTHADASVPGATGPVPTLTRATVKQTALRDPAGKIKLPPQLTVTYTGYRFYAE